MSDASYYCDDDEDEDTEAKLDEDYGSEEPRRVVKIPADVYLRLHRRETAYVQAREILGASDTEGLIDAARRIRTEVEQLQADLADRTAERDERADDYSRELAAHGATIKDRNEALKRAELERDRLRAAVERVSDVLEANGCDCACEHHPDEHGADCELCLGCRVDAALCASPARDRP